MFSQELRNNNLDKCFIPKTLGLSGRLKSSPFEKGLKMQNFSLYAPRFTKYDSSLLQAAIHNLHL